MQYQGKISSTGRSQVTTLYSDQNYHKELSKIKQTFKFKLNKQTQPQTFSVTQQHYLTAKAEPDSARLLAVPKIKHVKSNSLSNVAFVSRKRLVENKVSLIMKPYLKEQLTEFFLKLNTLEAHGKNGPQQKSQVVLTSTEMNEINLIRPAQNTERNTSPAQDSTTPIQNEDSIKGNKEIWQELKPHGKLPKPRSYHTAVFYNDSMLVLGGRDNNRGSYGDICQLKWSEQGLTWTEVMTIGDSPAYLSGHQAIVVGDSMFVYGGRISIFENSNKMYELDLLTMRWYIRKTQGEKPIGVDGHTMVEYPQGVLTIFGGFSAKPLCKSLNYIQQYNLSEHSFQILTPESSIQGRAYHGATVCKGKMWVFGGVDCEVKYDDFWAYEHGSDWQRIQVSRGPGVSHYNYSQLRLGLVLFADEERLYLFGGSSNILQERNDLWTYDGQTWICLESGVDLQGQMGLNQLSRLAKDKILLRRPSLKKLKANQNDIENDDETESLKPSELSYVKIEIKRNKAIENYLNVYQNKSNTYITNNDEQQDKDQKIDRFQIQKKKQLLADFQLTKEEEKRFKVQTPMTSQMQQSIISIENPQSSISNHRQSREKLSLYYQAERQIKQKNTRPLPRDGVTAVFFPGRNGWILFGGDRHKVTFNDLWFLDKDQLSKYSD